MQKNQKIKASPASLLAPCTPLVASLTRASRSNSDAPNRSVPVVRLTLTSRGRSYPSPSASAIRITSFLLLFNRIFPFNRIYNPIVLSIRIFNPIIRYHNPSPLRHLRRKILRLYKHPGDSSTQNEAIKPTKLIFNFQFSIQTGLTEEA